MLIDYERINALRTMQIHGEKSDTKRQKQTLTFRQKLL